MTKPLIQIDDEIRPMTNEELAQFLIVQEAAADKLTKENEAAAAKAELLNRLGISQEEAALLLG